ncbi:hypothetical protein ASA1KI_44730 [Opitutales bacterium ASA1]|uniref:hypothetical protein n=1 Tax=Congregicoccus parvus TaxID=3081749 RepID=UPI002B2CCB77|nr:hypothetical protein ASA1KI_44730 [Opitutales bacterium ASA1]
MKHRTSKPKGGVVNSLFLLTLFMLAYMAAIGFGTVWLRYEISVTANTNKGLESEIADVQRRLLEVGAQVAGAQSPEQLLRQNRELGINLVRPREDQVVRETEDVERRLAAKRFGLLFSTIEPTVSRPKETP